MSIIGETLQEMVVENDIESILEEVRPIIERKYRGRIYGDSTKYGILDKDDYISIMETEIWKALKDYDSNKASCYTFIVRVIDLKTIDFIRHCCANKNMVNVARTSVDMTEEGITSASAYHPIAKGLIGQPFSGVNQSTINAYIEKSSAKDNSFAEIDLKIFMDTVLTPRERTVLRLRSQGYNNPEIGKVLGISKARVGQLIKQAKSKWDNA